MSPQEKNMIREKPQEKDPRSDARKRLQEKKNKEAEIRGLGGEEPGHFDKIEIGELTDEDIDFYLEFERGNLNSVLVKERLNKLKEERALESRLEFIGYIANQVILSQFDRRI